MAEIIDQNIGTATAYGYAKNKGYEGTEDQFAQDMANVGTNIHEITEAINTFNNVTVPAATASVNSAGETQVASVNSAGLAQVAAVNSVGASQVSTITSTGTVVLNGIQAEGLAQVTAVSSAGAVQVATVNSAGSTQIAAVNSAGAVQVAAVNSKGQEVIQSIPADYTALTQEVSDLDQALQALPEEFGYVREDSEELPIISAYNNAGGGTLSGDDSISFESGASLYQFRLGKSLLFNKDYFIGKKFIFTPHFTITGDTSHLMYVASKQSGNTCEITVLDNNINNPVVLLDFTNASLEDIRYKYIYSILGANGNFTVSEATTITYTGYELKEYVYTNTAIDEVNKRIDAIDDYIINPCTDNVFKRDEAITTGYYAANGNFVADPSYVISTNFMPIVKNEYISHSRLNNSLPIIDFWDENKTFLGSVNQRYAKCTYDDAAYATMTIFPSEKDTVNITKGKITTVGGEIGYSSILRPFAYDKPLMNRKGYWYGKHMATIGDSLTQMGYWQDHVCNTLGMTYTKYAQSGGNMISIANFIEDVTDVPDLFTIWAGTNDWAGNIPLGDFLSENDQTYAGAINKLCKKLGNDFQKSRILFITPMQRGDTANFPTQNKNAKGYYINTNGASLEDFADMCKQTAEYYGYNCLDMFHDSGVNPLNITYYSGDKLHPDLNGFELLAFHKLIPKILTI